MHSNRLISLLIALACIALLSCFIVYRSDNIADYDSFYHITHAKNYLSNGIFDPKFPWVQFSMISKLGGDLWYGFHVLLIPFTHIDGIHEIKVPAVVFTTASLYLFYVALKMLGVKLPLFWTLIVPLAMPDILFRLAMLRPHVISFGISFLIFAALFKKKPWIVFVCALLVAWLHVNIFWLLYVIFATYLAVNYRESRTIDVRPVIYMSAGIIIGLFLRPDVIATIKLLYVQLVDLSLIKLKNIQVVYGSELRPANLNYFLSQFVPWLTVWATFVVLVINKIKRSKISLPPTILASAILASVFGLLTIFFAIRFVDVFVGYSIVIVSILFTQMADKIAGRPKYTLITAGFLLFGLLVVSANSLATSAVRLANSPPYDKFMLPANWLAKNSQPGQIVFNVYWGHFPVLYYWNQNNYYIVGMDPVFLYKYDTRLYWAKHFFEVNMANDHTCPMDVCYKDDIVPTYDVLKDWFKSSYVLVQQNINQGFDSYMASRPDLYTNVFETNTTRIYKIN